jgi:hypothetical protein
VRRVFLAAGLGVAFLPTTAHAASPSCATTVSSASEAASAVSAAAAGSVVCLADGEYDAITLHAAVKPPGVTLMAQNPGKATVAGVTLEGSHLTVAHLRLTGQVTIGPNSVGMTVDHNLLVGRGPGSGHYGVLVCPATPPDHCDDVSITANRFVGRFDEDAIRANVYHDGPDPDAYGLLVEGNEFTGNVEYGGHNDVFQSVWVGDHLYFRRNYVHDFGGQGVLIKDQSPAIEGLVIEDNLIVRQNLPCDPKSLCPTWQLSPLQVFGPVSNGSIRHNTIWSTDRAGSNAGGPVLLREGSWSNVTYSHNVVDRGAREAATTLGGKDNTRCADAHGPAPPGTETDCSPAFVNPAAGDFRQADGRGVTWKVADQHFGPRAGSRAVPDQPAAAVGVKRPVVLAALAAMLVALAAGAAPRLIGRRAAR